MSTKETVLKQRAAYVQGVHDGRRGVFGPQQAAKTLYPLPMIEKPRVIARTLSGHPGYSAPREILLSIKEGKLVHGWRSYPDAGYDTFNTLSQRREAAFTADDVRLIAEAYAELLKQPTELVEDDS